MVVGTAVAKSGALVVVWADPGISTGWSVHRVPLADLLARGQVGSTAVTWSRVGQYRSSSTSAAVDSYLSLCREVHDRLDEEDIMVVGCEGFTLMMQSTDPALLEPVRFLAVLRDRLREAEVYVEVQGASDAKKMITDERLKLWGLWQPGQDHGRDAQRHGLLFLRRFCNNPKVRERYM